MLSPTIHEMLVDMGIYTRMPYILQKDSNPIQPETLAEFTIAMKNISTLVRPNQKITIDEKPLTSDELKGIEKIRDDPIMRIIPLFEMNTKIGFSYFGKGFEDTWWLDHSYEERCNNASVLFPKAAICALILVIYLHVGYTLPVDKIASIVLQNLDNMDLPQNKDDCATLWRLYFWFKRLVTCNADDGNKIMQLCGLTLSALRSHHMARCCSFYNHDTSSGTISTCTKSVVSNAAVCETHNHWGIRDRQNLMGRRELDEEHRTAPYGMWNFGSANDARFDAYGECNEPNCWIEQFMIDIGVYFHVPPLVTVGPILPSAACSKRSRESCYDNTNNEYFWNLMIEPFSELHVMLFPEYWQVKRSDCVPTAIEQFLFQKSIENKSMEEQNELRFLEFFSNLRRKPEFKIIQDRINETQTEHRMFVLPLVVHWLSDKQGIPVQEGHSIVLFLDTQTKEQWFFDPSGVIMLWCEYVVFLEGWTSHLVVTMARYKGKECSLQCIFSGLFSPSIEKEANFATDKICTTMSALFVALVARYNAKGRHLTSLSANLSAWAVRMSVSKNRPKFGIEAIRYRLIQWQERLSRPDFEDPDCLCEPLGIGLLAGRTYQLRPCGVFTSEGNERCMRINQPGWTICSKHLLHLITAGSYGAPQTLPSVDLNKKENENKRRRLLHMNIKVPTDP